MLNLVANGPSGYTINNSLRFRSSATANLTRTPASAGNRQKWTWSGWMKRGTFGAGGIFFSGGTLGSTTYDTVFFNGESLGFNSAISGVAKIISVTSAVFRDPSAWYHIVYSIDTTQATGTNGIKIYVNGVQQTVTVSTYTQNQNTSINNNVIQETGGLNGYGSEYFDGYLAEINFIDGQALTPSSFGSTNATTGVWQPAKYTGTYGTNGFYLNFNSIALTSGSNTGLGKDNSGNGNYWNTNNISVTAGTTYDAMLDVPTLTSATVANYAVLNPLASRSVGTMQNGNLTWKKSDANADNYCCASTMSIPSSGKWYWEITVTDGASGSNSIGIIPDTSTTQQTANTQPGAFGITTNAFGYYSDGNKYTTGSATAYGSAYTTGDIIGIAVDTTNGKIWWSKNGTFQASGDPAAGTNAAFTTLSGSYYAASSVRFNNNQHDYNFGQRPFTYTPPTGFVALNTYNLPTSTIVQGNKYMDATLATGNNSTQVIVNQGQFKPDFVWLKIRSAVENHIAYDSVRGVQQYLVPNLTSAEATLASGLTSFNSNGFTLGSANPNYSGSPTFVGWQWQAGQGSSSSNTNGTITSTVSVNASAGFSIATFTCPASGSFTIGHGLGVTPAMVIVKGRQSVNQWYTWHKSLNNNAPSNTYYVNLSSTAAQATLANMWGTTGMTSSTVGLNATSASVVANENYVAYCWAEIAGFSKFGSFTANNSADGNFIYLGFLPRWIMTKQISGAGGAWFILDTARNTYNVMNNIIDANTSAAERNANIWDATANGMKLRIALSGDFIYAAFASNPFKNSNSF
jgi:hypothetical protein